MAEQIPVDKGAVNKTSIKKDQLSISIEDLITVVCVTFVESLKKLGYDDFKTVEEWYMGKTDQERFRFSEIVLDEIEKGVDAD